MLHMWKIFRKEQRAEDDLRLHRAGITLVETMVSVTLLMIMMAMVVGIVSPAFKVFIRMQKLQFAQMILDNVVEDVQDTVREATTYVKIYESNGGAATSTGTATSIAGREGISGDGSGLTLEYVNTDGYVVLVSTGGCSTTYLYRNNMIDSTFDAVNPGQLLFRYYRRVDTSSGSSESGDHNELSGSGESNESDNLSDNGESDDSNALSDSDESGEDNRTGNQYYYETTKDRNHYEIARAATTAFGSGYYMGNYLKIEFSFPEGISDGDPVTRLQATASLYNDSEMTDLVVTEDFIIDLRYDVEREDGVTAISESNESGESSMEWNITLSGE